MKLHRWIYFMVLAGCVQSQPCGLFNDDGYTVPCASQRLIHGPANATACDCPYVGETASEVETTSCAFDELECGISPEGQTCLCQSGFWHCAGDVQDLSIRQDLSTPDLQTEDLRESD